MGIYVRPTSVSDALAARAAGAEILAGGTDFWPTRVGKATYETPHSTILDLSALVDLRTISMIQGTLRIGALATWSDLAEMALPPALRALQLAAREVGGRQIQNRGTIGGNLCNASPAADSVPPLLALDAKVELLSSAGKRILPLHEFLIGPRRTALQSNEILAALLVANPHPAARSTFMKIGARKYQLISIVMGAAVLRVSDGYVREAAISIGSCSPVAQRLGALETALIGVRSAGLSDHVKAIHLAHLAPINDVRADASYRQNAALVVTRRLLTAFEAMP